MSAYLMQSGNIVRAMSALLLLGVMMVSAPVARQMDGLLPATFVVSVVVLSAVWLAFSWRTDRTRVLRTLAPRTALAWFVLTVSFALIPHYPDDSIVATLAPWCVVFALSLAALDTTFLAHRTMARPSEADICLVLLVGIGPAPFLVAAHYLLTWHLAPTEALHPQTFAGPASLYLFASSLPLYVLGFAVLDTAGFLQHQSVQVSNRTHT